MKRNERVWEVVLATLLAVVIPLALMGCAKTEDNAT